MGPTSTATRLYGTQIRRQKWGYLGVLLLALLAAAVANYVAPYLTGVLIARIGTPEAIGVVKFFLATSVVGAILEWGCFRAELYLATKGYQELVPRVLEMFDRVSLPMKHDHAKLTQATQACLFGFKQATSICMQNVPMVLVGCIGSTVTCIVLGLYLAAGANVLVFAGAIFLGFKLTKPHADRHHKVAKAAGHLFKLVDGYLKHHEAKAYRAILARSAITAADGLKAKQHEEDTYLYRRMVLVNSVRLVLVSSVVLLTVGSTSQENFAVVFMLVNAVGSNLWYLANMLLTVNKLQGSNRVLTEVLGQEDTRIPIAWDEPKVEVDLRHIKIGNTQLPVPPHVLTPGIWVYTAPSGKGKTTLLRLLNGAKLDYDGMVLIGGYDIAAYRPDNVFYLPPDIEGTEIVVADLFPCGDEADIKTVLNWASFPEAASYLDPDLDPDQERKTEHFSTGQTKRLYLAHLLFCASQAASGGEACLLVLDEPTANLDPENVEAVVEGLGAFSETYPNAIIAVGSPEKAIHRVAPPSRQIVW